MMMNSGGGYGGYGAGGMYGYSNTYGTGGGLYPGSGYGAGYSRYGAGSMYGNGAYGYGNPQGGMNGWVGRFENQTRGTFELIENIVNAFAGFAQMLESTYIATHSGFMAMMGVADSFNHVKQYFASALEMIAIWRYFKRFWFWLTGRNEFTPSAFERYNQSRGMTGSDYRRIGPNKTFSKKPLFFVLFVLFGIPYLFNKFLSLMANDGPITNSNKRIEDEHSEGIHQKPELSDQQTDRQVEHLTQGKSSTVTNKNNNGSESVAEYEFGRALHQFKAESPNELGVEKGDLIMMVEKPEGNDWWKGRLQNGQVGWIPKNFVELHKKKITIPKANPIINTNIGGTANLTNDFLQSNNNRQLPVSSS